MARRRRRTTRRRSPNPWFIVFQIIVLVALLVAVISVADSIGEGTGILVDSLATEDLVVGDQDGEGPSELGAERTDDRAEPEPASTQPLGDTGIDSGTDAGR